MLTQTIANQFRWSQTSPEEIIENVSDGEFDPKFLARYSHIDELTRCCESAVQSLAAEPFVGRKSCGDVMGRAMELLKHRHGLNAPRGWLPVMRKLRSSPGEIRTKNINEEQTSNAQECIDAMVPEAEELFTHHLSALPLVGEGCGDALCMAADKSPELRELLMKTAKERGVPTCWAAALLFVDSVTAALGHEVPEALIKIQERLELHCEDYWPPDMEPRVRRSSDGFVGDGFPQRQDGKKSAVLEIGERMEDSADEQDEIEEILPQ